MTDTPAPATVSGDPGRYAYARSLRTDTPTPARPPVSAVELHLRAETGVAEGPIPSEKLDAVTGLRLDLSRPEGFASLSGLRNITWLSIECPVAIDLAGLADAVEGLHFLRDLRITSPVRDVAPLARLTSLTRLGLEHTLVTDARPLAALTGLRDLSICDGPFDDISQLAGLSPDRLFLYRSGVTDLAPLAGWPGLNVLGLVGCDVRDLSPLLEMPDLQHVNLHDTPAPDAAVILRLLSRGVGVDTPDYDDDADEVRPEPPADPLAAYLASEDYLERHRLQPHLVATRDVRAIRELIPGEVSVTGLLFRDGRGDVPFPPNAWGVPPGAGLTGAIETVWGPVADLAPMFVRTAHERTLALAHVTGADGAESLAYIVSGTNDDRMSCEPAWQVTRRPPGLDDLTRLGEDEYVRVVTGTAPQAADPEAVVPVLGGPVPGAVRRLWAVHHGIGGHYESKVGGRLDGNVLGFCQGDRDEGLKRTGGKAEPDRLVLAVGQGDFESYALDLDVLDHEGEPTVVTWFWKEWGTGVNRWFWDWFDDEGTRLVWL